jgi:hypothetical protein
LIRLPASSTIPFKAAIGAECTLKQSSVSNRDLHMGQAFETSNSDAKHLAQKLFSQHGVTILGNSLFFS